jgi:hypothetical protein
VLGGIQIGAISIILVFSARYRGLVCATHAMSPAHDSLRSVAAICRQPATQDLREHDGIVVFRVVG